MWVWVAKRNPDYKDPYRNSSNGCGDWNFWRVYGSHDFYPHKTRHLCSLCYWWSILWTWESQGGQELHPFAKGQNNSFYENLDLQMCTSYSVERGRGHPVKDILLCWNIHILVPHILLHLQKNIKSFKQTLPICTMD